MNIWKKTNVFTYKHIPYALCSYLYAYKIINEHNMGMLKKLQLFMEKPESLFTWSYTGWRTRGFINLIIFVHVKPFKLNPWNVYEWGLNSKPEVRHHSHLQTLHIFGSLTNMNEEMNEEIKEWITCIYILTPSMAHKIKFKADDGVLKQNY